MVAGTVIMKNRVTVEISHDCEGIDWAEAAEIMRRAPLADRSPDMVHRCFCGSDIVVFARHSDRLVGFTRMLTDHVCQSVLYDLCVTPEYQGRGVGSAILKAALARCKAPNVVLWAVPGKEPFYAKHNFRHMLTAMANFAEPTRLQAQGYIR
jgi:GNAT superfamily N-acetyltransferase